MLTTTWPQQIQQANKEAATEGKLGHCYLVTMHDKYFVSEYFIISELSQSIERTLRLK